MRSFIALSLIVLASCSGESKKISATKLADYKGFFASTYKQIDSAARIDSFTFVRFDTITEKGKLYAYVDAVTERINSLADVANSQLKLYKTHKNLERLSADISYASSSVYRDDAEKNMEEAKRIGDRLNYYKSEMDTVQKMLPKSDSTKPVAFYAVCAYQVRQGNYAVKRDTAFLLVNTNKDIIERKDFFIQLRSDDFKD